MRSKLSRVLGVLAIGLASAGTAAAAVTPLPAQLACAGNEPFWHLTIDGDGAGWSRLAAGGTTRDELAGVRTDLDHLERRQIVWRGRATGDAGDLVALITEEPCRDTMADAAFAYSARISLPDGEALVGCCRAGPAGGPATSTRASLDLERLPVADLGAKPVGDWSRFLLELRPPIAACLARTPGSAPRVTKAWPMNHGMAGVRTRDGEGGWFTCVASAEGGRVDRFDVLAERTERLPGEGVVLFVPAPQSPPAGECYEHERVLDATGRLIGWLSYDTC